MPPIGSNANGLEIGYMVVFAREVSLNGISISKGGVKYENAKGLK